MLTDERTCSYLLFRLVWSQDYPTARSHIRPNSHHSNCFIYYYILLLLEEEEEEEEEEQEKQENEAIK